MQIEQEMPLIGDKATGTRHPPFGRPLIDIRRAQQLGDGGPGGLGAEPDDLDRQRERAQRPDQFSGIGDRHHPLRRGRDDLFLQQRPAAALDQPQRRVCLVGAVDNQIERCQIVERAERNAQRRGPCGRGRGGRHAGDRQALVTDPRSKAAQHPVRGRPGAKPQLHPRLHLRHRGGRSGMFGTVGR
jgi:hypothetical protein